MIKDDFKNVKEISKKVSLCYKLQFLNDNSIEA